MLKLTIDVASLDRLRARLAEAPRLVAEQIEAGVAAAVETVAREVAQRTPVKTGALRDSLYTRVDGAGADAVGTVGFTADYAAPVETGTRPHTIRARGKVLRFTVGGRVIYAPEVNHPGTRGAHMFRDGVAAALPKVRRGFSARIGVVTRRLAGN